MLNHFDPTSASPPGPTYDLSTLQVLYEGDDKGFFRLLKDMIIGLQEFSEDYMRGVQAVDLERLRKTIHKYRSTFRMVGMEWMEALADKGKEALLHGGDAQLARQYAHSIIMQISAVVNSLQARVVKFEQASAAA